MHDFNNLRLNQRHRSIAAADAKGTNLDKAPEKLPINIHLATSSRVLFVTQQEEANNSIHNDCIHQIYIKEIIGNKGTDNNQKRQCQFFLQLLFEQINREGQTILMVTHSAKAASRASRVLFIKDGEVFHQLYRGGRTNEAMFTQIADTLTALATGGADRG